MLSDNIEFNIINKIKIVGSEGRLVKKLPYGIHPSAKPSVIKLDNIRLRLNYLTLKERLTPIPTLLLWQLAPKYKGWNQP